MSRRLQVGGFALLAVLSGPRAAYACTQTYCPEAQLVPWGGVVPAGLAEFYVQAESSAPGVEGIWLNVADGQGNGDPVPVQRFWPLEPKSAAVQLAGGLVPGFRYALELGRVCDDQQPRDARGSVITVEQEVVPAPTTLGALTVVNGGLDDVSIAQSGLCFAELQAGVADLTLDLSHMSEGWRNVVRDYTLIVDGVPFQWRASAAIGELYPSPGLPPAASPRGWYLNNPGTFRVWTRCAAEPAGQNGLPAGKHTVKVRAVVPDGKGTVIESDAVEVTLRCDEVIEGDDAGVDVPTDAAVERDAASDAGDAGADASAVKTDASVQPDDEPEPRAKADGGCSLAGDAAPNAAGLLMALGLLLWRRRSRVPG